MKDFVQFFFLPKSILKNWNEIITGGEFCKPAAELRADRSHLPPAVCEACWQFVNPPNDCSLLVQNVKSDLQRLSFLSFFFKKGMTKM